MHALAHLGKLLHPGRAARLLMLSFLLAPGFLSAADETETSHDALSVRIAELIEQLGAPQYATRMKAQGELERLGLAAFDALHEARNHRDLEIAHRARYLVLAMRVNWAREDDPAEVQNILRGYEEQNEEERKTRMQRLGGLENQAGAPALVRIVRFENSEQLSKQAALQLVMQPQPATEEARRALSEELKRDIGLSRRPAAEWITAHAESLLDRAAGLDRWQELVAAEQDLLRDYPQRTSRTLVRDLLRWHAAELGEAGRESDAVAAMRQAIEFVEPQRQDLLEMIDWLLKRKARSVVEEIATRYAAEFEKDPILLYRLAESRLEGQEELAKATAQKAFELQPEEPGEHVVAALMLQERGMFEWAEREYRFAMEVGPIGSLHDTHARLLLSEMLHDQLRDQHAAETLQVLSDAMERDPAVLRMVEERVSREPSSIRSRMHFFYAEHFKTSDPPKREEHLLAAIGHDPNDADVLIAMYRTPEASEEFRAKTMRQIDASIGRFRTEISEFRDQAQQADANVALKNWAERRWATACNQLAWLVSNTEGDLEEAVECSHKSLELVPDAAGYLDTLGRCYYAKGDFANAVKYQRQAAELEPNAGQIRRQLKLFERALAEAEGQPE